MFNQSGAWLRNVKFPYVGFLSSTHFFVATLKYAQEMRLFI